MTTETILTDAEKANFVADIIGYGTDFVAPIYAVVESIEQAVLQSPEMQALRKDARRYQWLRAGGNDDIGVVRGFDGIDCGSTSVAYTYEEVLSGEQLDEAIDHARRIEGDGE